MKVIAIAVILLLFVSSNCAADFSFSRRINCEIEHRNDGGFTIKIDQMIQHLTPVTAEGFFPKEKVSYQIELIGAGKSYEYRNQSGFYYSYPDSVEPNKRGQSEIKYYLISSR